MNTATDQSANSFIIAPLLSADDVEQDHADLLPLITRLTSGENVVGEIVNLGNDKLLAACKIVAGRWSIAFDHPADQNEYYKFSGKDKVRQYLTPPFTDLMIDLLGNLSTMEFRDVTRSYIGVERVIKASLDENPKWIAIANQVIKDLTDSGHELFSAKH